jgi:uncharacterized membrane protein YkoI
MKRRTIIITAGILATAAGVGIAGAASAGQGGDDNEQPIRGDALVSASEAALAHTGGGTVTETEVGDEESLYEVEVTLDSGQQVDVQLDEAFNVVGSEADDENDQNDND